MFQNDVVLYFKSYWKRTNVADISFSDFNKSNDWDSQWIKSSILPADQVKVMASKSEQKIAAGNGMWVTHPSHLNVNIKRSVANLGDLAGMQKKYIIIWNFFLF